MGAALGRLHVTKGGHADSYHGRPGRAWPRSADRYGLQMDWSEVPHDRVMAAIELLGTEVLPQVQKAFAA